jgi:cytoskeletal protein CcmA (bactofilin family)
LFTLEEAVFNNRKWGAGMKKKEPLDHVSTLLGLGTTIEGTLAFTETIRLDGVVNGKILSEKGTLIIGERAVVEAQIQVATAIVRGTVTGHIVATNRIDLYAPANIHGDIQAPVVAIENGVRLNGNCRMAPSQPQPAGPVQAGAKQTQAKPG